MASTIEYKAILYYFPLNTMEKISNYIDLKFEKKGYDIKEAYFSYLKLYWCDCLPQELVRNNNSQKNENYAIPLVFFKSTIKNKIQHKTVDCKFNNNKLYYYDKHIKRWKLMKNVRNIIGYHLYKTKTYS